MTSLTFACLFLIFGVLYAADAASLLLFVVLIDAGLRTVHGFVHRIGFDGYDSLWNFMFLLDFLLDDL